MKEECPTFRPTLHVSSSGGNLRVLIYIDTDMPVAGLWQLMAGLVVRRRHW